MFGSFAETGLDYSHCFDRYSRYKSYGFDEGGADEAGNKAKREETLDWKKVDWGQLQRNCLAQNLNRYELVGMSNHTTLWLPTKKDTGTVDSTLYFDSEPEKSRWWSSRTSFKKRSAVVIHMEPSNGWTIDAMQYFRSLIVELSLHSGAEYEVIFLVDVNDAPRSIFTDPGEYEKTLVKSAPDEFRGNTLLYNSVLVEEWYPKVPKQKYVPLEAEKGACADRHSDDSMTKKMNMNQALQLLSLLRPDIEHFWQFESDARYTGHHYQHLETISAWSETQPRRLLWERSSRYFISGIQGDWKTFAASFENTTSDGGIWGPVRAEGIEPIGPDPPTESPNQDNYTWGVGEEADLITTAPILDSTGSGFAEFMSAYPQAGNTPSRLANLPIMVRFSKRLLRAMHHGQATVGASMPAARYPASTALHHGLKAVAFPMPIFLDYAKRAKDVENEYNFDMPERENGGDKAGAMHNKMSKIEELGERMSFFSDKVKENGFGDEIYKRWLGYVSFLLLCSFLAVCGESKIGRSRLVR